MNRPFLHGRFLPGREQFFPSKLKDLKVASGLESRDLAGRLQQRNERIRERNTRYRTKITASLTVSLLLLTALFRMPFNPGSSFDITVGEQEIVQVEEIEQTRQVEAPPPPPRPPVPIAVADDTLLDLDEILFDSELDAAVAVNVPPPPAPREEREEITEAEIFVVVEQMPEIVGGLASLRSILQYPEMARRAGLEGRVVIQVVIEPDGTPSNPVVARSAGAVLDEAAVEAVMKLQYKPGMQRGRTVRVRYAIPVNFRLGSVS